MTKEKTEQLSSCKRAILSLSSFVMCLIILVVSIQYMFIFFNLILIICYYLLRYFVPFEECIVNIAAHNNEKDNQKLWDFLCVSILILYGFIEISGLDFLLIGSLFLFAPIYLFRNNKGIIQYLFMSAFFLILVLNLIILFEKKLILVYTLENRLYTKKIEKNIIIFVIILWITFGCFLLIKRSYYESNLHKIKISFIAWHALFVSAFFVNFFRFNESKFISSTTRPYVAFETYLLFDERWGIARGPLWRKGIDTFDDFSAIRKLIGYGPANIGNISKNTYNEMLFIAKLCIDTSENAYRQFLTAIGVLGLFRLLSLIVSMSLKQLTPGRKNLHTRGMLWVIIIQTRWENYTSLFNIPFLFLCYNFQLG